MSRFTTRLAEVCALLNQERARYALVGDRALQLWGSSQGTDTIAMLIEPTADNARRVLQAMQRAGCGFAREWLAHEVAARQATVIGNAPRMDILTVAGGLHYHEAAPAARTFLVDGVAIPVASIDHLIASKRTRYPEDRADVEWLEELRRLGET